MVMDLTQISQLLLFQPLQCLGQATLQHQDEDMVTVSYSEANVVKDKTLQGAQAFLDDPQAQVTSFEEEGNPVDIGILDKVPLAQVNHDDMDPDRHTWAQEVLEAYYMDKEDTQMLPTTELRRDLFSNSSRNVGSSFVSLCYHCERKVLILHLHVTHDLTCDFSDRLLQTMLSVHQIRFYPGVQAAKSYLVFHLP